MAHRKGRDASHATLPAHLREELLGLALAAAGVMVLLALVSYDPEDPAWGATGAREVQNYLGRLGALAARLLLEIFGLAAHLLPVLFVGPAITLFLRRVPRVRGSQIFGFCLLLVAVSGLLALDLARWRGDTVEQTGGLLGLFVADGLRAIMGAAGAHIVLFLILAVAVMVSLRVSLVALAGRALRGVKRATRAAARECALFLGRLQRRGERHAEARREPAWADGPVHEPVISRTRPQPAPSASPAKEEPEPEAAARPEPAVPPQPVPEPAPEPEAVRVISPAAERPARRPARRPRPPEAPEKYELPSTALLDPVPDEARIVDRELLLSNSQILVNKMKHFDVEGRVVEVRPGPIVTMYEFEPAPGVKVSKIANLDRDLALALKASRIRIVAPLPERGTIGIEVPNRDREIVYLRDVFESPEFQESRARLPIVLGKDIFGHPYVTDLSEMPHLLVAGTTGSGKSVFLNAVVLSILFKHPPERVRLLMVDPKMLEFQDYDGIPSLLLPVVTNVNKASTVLRQAVDEMERRYRLMAEMGVRDLEGYNRKVEKLNAEPETHRVYTSDDGGKELVHEEPILHQPLPYIVLIIDEFADLMMVAPKDILESVQRLAQMARAAGIHLILATQRPSKDVITGDIKANMSARISFQLRTKVDSRVILDSNGAESLLGMGDMLFLPSKNPKLTRLHAPYVSEREIRRVVEHCRTAGGPPPVETMFSLDEEATQPPGPDEEFFDERYEDAKRLVEESGKATISYVQRVFKIGYNRAARIIEQMEREGLISPPDHTGAREIYHERF